MASDKLPPPVVGGGEGPDLLYNEWGRLRRLSHPGSVAGPAARCRECRVITWRLSNTAIAPHRTSAAHRSWCGIPPSKLEES